MRVIIYIYILFSAGTHSNANVLLSCTIQTAMQTACTRSSQQTSEDGTRYICASKYISALRIYMHSVSSDHHQALERFTIIISYLNLIARLARLFDFIVHFTTITSTCIGVRSSNKNTIKTKCSGAFCLTTYKRQQEDTKSMAFIVLGFYSSSKRLRIRFDNYRLQERIIQDTIFEACCC